jgi:ribosomal protein L16
VAVCSGMQTTFARFSHSVFARHFRHSAMSFLATSLRALPRLLNFASSSNGQQIRHATKFAPTYVRHARVHKGRAPVPIGGSLKGTTLSFGEYGIRVKGEGLRISAKQLMAAEAALKRKLKVVKGAKLWMRVFPDFPVCVKVRISLLNARRVYLRNIYREMRRAWEKAKARSNTGHVG